MHLHDRVEQGTTFVPSRFGNETSNQLTCPRVTGPLQHLEHFVMRDCGALQQLRDECKRRVGSQLIEGCSPHGSQVVRCVAQQGAIALGTQHIQQQMRDLDRVSVEGVQLHLLADAVRKSIRVIDCGAGKCGRNVRANSALADRTLVIVGGRALAVHLESNVPATEFVRAQIDLCVGAGRDFGKQVGNKEQLFGSRERFDGDRRNPVPPHRFEQRQYEYKIRHHRLIVGTECPLDLSEDYVRLRRSFASAQQSLAQYVLSGFATQLSHQRREGDREFRTVRR